MSRRYLINGRVQGVFFRHSARAEAERLAIRGVARNLPDGSVEVIAYGARAAVERFREWLNHGPPMAGVDSIHEVELASPAPDAAPTGFSVE